MNDNVLSSDQLVDELSRQIERASLFTHTALGEGFSRLSESQSFLYGLADVLLAKGYVTEQELAAAMGKVREELMQRGELSGPGVMVRIDSDEVTEEPAVSVDCSARLPVCKAACCRLDFALAVSEVESGAVKWDLGRPYFIRHGADGACVHSQAGGGGCSVYVDRPNVCRRYSCARDARIWTNFERMELNNEWIEENLGPQGTPRAIGVLMHEAMPSFSLSKLSPRSEEEGA